jgi:hypothetical protein
MQPTLHFQSGTIILATLTSLLPTLVRRFAGSMFPIASIWILATYDVVRHVRVRHARTS